jgi:hypothetical protein
MHKAATRAQRSKTEAVAASSSSQHVRARKDKRCGAVPHTLLVHPINAGTNAHELLEARYVVEHHAVERGAPTALVAQLEALADED